MSRNYKTGQNSRTNYIYYGADGTKTVLIPGENGVTETQIEILHAMDDTTLDAQRRYNYRTSIPIDEVIDNNPAVAGNIYSPDQVLLEQLEDQEYQNALERLKVAMGYLLPQQKELFKKKYVDKRSNTDIAAEEGVTEAAIRDRLKKMNKKIKKYFL